MVCEATPARCWSLEEAASRAAERIEAVPESTHLNWKFTVRDADGETSAGEKRASMATGGLEAV